MARNSRFRPDYFDNSDRVNTLAGGIRMIPVDAPGGPYRVWTKRVGNNTSIKVLLLHGGPGSTHEYLQACDSFLPAAGVEYYYYDQLGSAYSDQPKDLSYIKLPHFVEEVEQVRQALGLGPDNFYLYGHSWGGWLSVEYALKYQQHLKGLILSNSMASSPAYNAYATNVLMPEIDPEALAEIKALESAGDYANPRFMELLINHHYINHVLRMPPEEWPEPVMRAIKNLNQDVYVSMQGPSELGLSGQLLDWDRTAELHTIKTPTLVIAARYDTMDPAHLEWMAKELPNGRYHFCSNGSHLCMYDDQEIYFQGLMDFLYAVDNEKG
ncbi:MAG TPA: proline iminopeptidase-family hydrolase [Promineifilum sp.]|nr:proline iminopeptidase-family hydrolase [Promineifilum sp.]